jgi:hypothetical protein
MAQDLVANLPDIGKRGQLLCSHHSDSGRLLGLWGSQKLKSPVRRALAIALKPRIARYPFQAIGIVNSFEKYRTAARPAA